MDNIIEKLKDNESFRLVGAHYREDINPTNIEYVTVLTRKKIDNVLTNNFKNVQLLTTNNTFRMYSINKIEVIFWMVSYYRFNYSTTYRILPKDYLKHIKKMAKVQGYNITKKGMYDIKTNYLILDWNKIMRILWLTSKNYISNYNRK